MKIALLFGRATKCYIAVSAHSTQSSKCLTIRWSVHAENSYVIKNYNATSFWLTVDTTERTLLCCSSYPNRTRYARLRFGLGCKLDRKSILTAYCTSEQAAYRLLRLFSKVRARSLRCSSFPNRTRFAGLRFGFGRNLERKSVLTPYSKPKALHPKA